MKTRVRDRSSLLATSTCEAEYVGLYDTVKITQGTGYLDWFDENYDRPTIFGDNQSSITVAKTKLPTKKTKHMLLRFHLVREYADDICYCPTGANMADPLTKPMQKLLMFFQTPTTEDLPPRKEIGLCCTYDTFCG